MHVLIEIITKDDCLSHSFIDKHTYFLHFLFLKRQTIHHTFYFYIMKAVLVISYFLLSILFSLVHGIAIDDFHCKVPTCRDFYFVSEFYFI